MLRAVPFSPSTRARSGGPTGMYSVVSWASSAACTAPVTPGRTEPGAVTGSNVNRGRGRFSASIRPDWAAVDGQIAQHPGRMAVVPDVGEPLSPQAADLVRR